MASLFNKLIKGRTKLTDSGKEKSAGVVGGCSPATIGDVMNYYIYGSYDNTFPSITRITEEIATVLPYAVGADGKRLETQPQLINAIYHPNKQNSVVEFIETMTTLALVFPKVCILCWQKRGNEIIAGGDIRADNIGGFTFLENPEIKYDQGTGYKTYTIRKNGQQVIFNEDEVIEISLNVNPYDLLEGYSPSMASKKWSNVDDYIADYQSGFFRNGAKPAGEFIITAKSKEEFADIVASMQAHHRGASANNNVSYVHKPIDATTGAVMPAQIEWVPFNQPNNQLGLKDIFEQANKKIDMTFGVPQEVKGYLTNSNYASVSVADYIFSKYVVKPKLIKIWSKFTHEMNRITGGLGFALSFDYETPILEDARKSQVENLTTLLDKGYTLESSVEALRLPKSFLMLAKPEETKEPEEEQQVEEQNNAEDADQFATAKKSVEVKKKIADQNAEIYGVAEEYLRKQIDSAKGGSIFDIAKESALFKTAMLAIVLGLIEDSGDKQYADGKEQLDKAGWDTELAKGFVIREEVKRDYSDYLGELALSYGNDTNEAIEKVLAQAEFENWTREQLEQELEQIKELDAWRAERIARTENHRADQLGRLEAMRELSATTGANIWKMWNVNPAIEDHCEDCLVLDGVKLPLDDGFGDFKAGDSLIADAHPNCGCFLTFEVDSVIKSVNVQCPNCRRHLFKGKSASIEGVKCQGCKKHFNINIKGGEVEATEVEIEK